MFDFNGIDLGAELDDYLYNDYQEAPDPYVKPKIRLYHNCVQCKNYHAKEQYDLEGHICSGWCKRWNNVKYEYQLSNGCNGFVLNPKTCNSLSPKSWNKIHYKEAQKIKRLKREGKIPLDYDEWAKAYGIGFMTGLGDEDGYDEYCSSFLPGFGPD